MRRAMGGRSRLAAGWLILGLVLLPPCAYSFERGGDEDDDDGYEVWAIDQSNSPGRTFGGTLYIYDGEALGERPAAARPEVVDLGGAVSSLCLAETGANPVRPHIVLFNANDTHAIIAFVASGHVVFLDAATRAPVRCFLMTLAPNGLRQAHAAFPAPNDRYVVVANQNGRLLERIDTDADGDGVPYEDASDLVHDVAATLDVASCTTPSGAPCQGPGVRPTNTVICPIVEATSTLTFVTLGGGGLLVVDTSVGGAPPPIVAEYDSSAAGFLANGCGGMQKGVTAGGTLYLNAGGPPRGAHLYAFPADPASYFAATGQVNVPARRVIFSQTTGDVDSHGLALNRLRRGRFLWAADRFANTIEVVDTTTDTHVGSFSLAGRVSADPAPDLMDLAPGGTRAFISLRGPCPLTANGLGVNNAVGATPGVGVVRVRAGGRSGKVIGVAPVHNVDGAITSCAPAGAPPSNDRADVHGIAVRARR